jgi:RNA polymerase sigma factor (sigma-70 family)
MELDLQTRSDGELLGDFATHRSEAVFEEIIRRHGSLVLNVCRRVLGNSSDAEDAAQAVFLTLARKAASLRHNASMAAWLHHVAWCVASNALAARAARRQHEKEAAMPAASSNEHAEEWAGLEAVVDREIDALPQKYRLPIVLFHLEGRSLDEICTLLQCKSGTLESWLSRGRAMLKSRIEKRGVAVTSVMLMSFPARNMQLSQIVPVQFVKATLQGAVRAAAGDLAAGGAVSTQTAALAEGAVKQMFMIKVKNAVVAAAAVIVVSLAALIGYSMADTKRDVLASKGEADIAPAKPSLKKVVEATDPDQIGTWVRQLGDQDFEVCIAAEEKLQKAGEAAREQLTKATRNENATVAGRAQRILDVLRVKPLIDKLMAARNAVKSWEADTEVIAKMGGQTVTSTGHMLASADSRLMKLDGTSKMMGMEVPLKVRSDGTNYWSEVKIPTGQVLVQKSAVVAAVPGKPGARKISKSRSLSYAFSELFERVDFVEAADGTLDGRDVHIISGLVKEAWANSETREDMVKVMGASMLDDLATMQKVRLSVDKETFYMLKSEILDANDGILMCTHMTNVKINVPLDEKEFVYSPPNDSQVMDLDAVATQKQPEAPLPSKPENF